MNARIDTLVEQAKALSSDEREALIAALQATLDPPDPQWEAAWVKECEERIAAVERGEMPLIDADQVMAEIRAKLRKR